MKRDASTLIAADRRQSSIVLPTRSGWITPIALSGGIVGALSLQQIDKDRQWTESEMTPPQTVANDVAADIDNTRSLDQPEHRAQHGQLISKISRKLLAASNMQRILQIAMDELGQALRATPAAVRIGADAPPDRSVKPNGSVHDNGGLTR